jgi:Tfp pilus assembly protein PilN
MRTLNLDFVNRHGRRRQIGYVLLVLFITFAAYLGHAYVKRSAELESLESKWQHLQNAQQRNTERRLNDPAAHERTQAELTAAAKVIERLSLPWNALFSALEQTTEGQVTLLALEPDAERREVRIAAEAKDLQSMLDYMKRLQQVDLFKDVHLTTHQMQAQDPQRPVRFVVQASWLDSSFKK